MTCALRWYDRQTLLVDFDLCVPTRLVFFDIGQSLLVDFCLCASTRLVFFTLVSCCWWTLACALPLVLSFFDTGQLLLVDFGLCAHTRLVFFDIGQALLVDFELCAPTRLVFFRLVFFTLVNQLEENKTLSYTTWIKQDIVIHNLKKTRHCHIQLEEISHCWWTLTCALPLVLSFWHWSVTFGGHWLVRSHWSCLFDIGQSLLVDFDLCAPTGLVFLTLVSHCWWTLTCALPLVLSFWHWSATVGGLWLARFHSSCLFDIGQPLLVDFDLRASTLLVFLTLVSHCWWTLTCALPLVLSFWHWSATVGGHWLVRSHWSCLFYFLHWSPIIGGLWLVRYHSSYLFGIGQSLLVDFGLCATTRLVFLILVSYCWWTLNCTLSLVLSFWYWSVTVGGLWLVRSHSSCLFWHWSPIIGGLWLVCFHSSCLFDIGQSLLVDIDLCAPTRLVFLTLVSHCWWTLTCALLLVLSFWHWSATVSGHWLVRSHWSCLFDIGQSLLVDFDLYDPTRLVFFDIGHLLLVDFDLCASTRLVFLTLVSHCWWTLTCALPLVLSFWHWSVTVCGLWLVRSHSPCLFWHWSPIIGGLWLVRFHSSCLFWHWSPIIGGLWLVRSPRLVFLTLVSHCWWTLTCALPLVLCFWHWSATVGGL